MFESILVRGGKANNESFDAGLLAEAMLFYRQVKVVCYYGTLKELLKKIPPYILLRALEQGNLQIFYAHEQSAVMTQNAGGKDERHDFSRFGLADTGYPEVVEKIFYEAAGKTSQSKLASKRFAKFVKPISYEGFDTTVVFNDVMDKTFMPTVVKDVMQLFAPEYQLPAELIFEASRDRSGLALETNIDFDAANRSYHLHIPKEHSSINPAYLLTLIQEAHLDIYFSSKLTSEISTTHVSSTILEKRFANILTTKNKNLNEIEIFSNLVLDSGYAIREAINSGKCNWVEYLKLLEKAGRFRHWLDNQAPDANLVKEYMREAFSKSWLENTPAKTLRWIIFNGAGFITDKIIPGSGLALSAIDTYLIDKIGGGWKPHHFVESQLKPAIQSKN